MGFDLGGMTALRLATSRRDIRAFAGVDSGIAHPALGRDYLEHLPQRKDLLLLHITRPAAELRARNLPEDLRILRASRGKLWVARVPGMRHVDFTINGFLETVTPGLWDTPPGQPPQRLAEVTELLARYFVMAFDGASRSELPTRFGLTSVDWVAP